jgi:hypothetical protein
MGLFKKKPDPIAEREKMLNQQIAALEAEIKKLGEAPADKSPEQPPEEPEPAPSAIPVLTTHPRLRSTARPRGQHGAASPSAPAATPNEPVFEEITRNPFTHSNGTPVQEELGTRRSDLPALWDRIKTHFRGPSTSNPKLVSYLAAGSIQGLRPLRYEKRVARNRFIVFAVILAALLIGLFAFFFKR